MKARMRAPLAALLIAAGCAAEKKVIVTPETRLAGAIQTFAKSADAFKASRREVVKTRLALLNEEESDAARLAADTQQRLAIWKIAKDAKRLEIYDQLHAATTVTGNTWSAFQAIQDQQQKALDAADSKVAIGADLVKKVIGGLTSLGTPLGLEKQAKLYVDFLVKTKAEMDRLNTEAAMSASKQSAEQRENLTSETAASPSDLAAPR